MAIQETETRQETARRLDNLGLTLATTVPQFLRYEGMAFATEDTQKCWLELALKYLEKIEDAIKCFREDRPQQFEKEPNDNR